MNFSGRSTKQGTEGTLSPHTVRKGASQLNSLQETCLPTDHGAGLEADSPQPGLEMNAALADTLSAALGDPELEDPDKKTKAQRDKGYVQGQS